MPVKPILGRLGDTSLHLPPWIHLGSASGLRLSPETGALPGRGGRGCTETSQQALRRRPMSSGGSKLPRLSVGLRGQLSLDIHGCPGWGLSPAPWCPHLWMGSSECFLCTGLIVTLNPCAVGSYTGNPRRHLLQKNPVK